MSRPIMKVLQAAFGVALLAAIAGADTITKKDGTKIEGKIVQQNDVEVVIQTGFGELKVPRSEIRTIESGKTAGELFKAKWDEVDKKDSIALLELADWCNENKLSREAKKVYREIVDKVDPDNEPARRALGYVKVNGEWRTKAELDAEKKAAADQEKKEKAEKAKAEKDKAKADKAKKTGKPAKGGEVQAGDVEMPPEVAGFIAEGAEESAADAEIKTKLEDFFGGKFSVQSSRNFRFRVQLPPDETDLHLRIAEKCHLDLNTLFGQDAESQFWRGQKFEVFIVQQKGAFTDLIDWIDQNVIELTPETKKFLKDGGGMNSGTKRGPLAARHEGDVPLKNAIPQWIGRSATGYLTGGRAAPWLEEGFGMYLAVFEYGVSLLTYVNEAKYENLVDVADKNSDNAYKLICHEVIEGRVEGGTRPWIELSGKNLNQLDYVDLAKCWSICDFMMAEDNRENFKKFLVALRTTQDQEVALQNAFGWSAAEFDAKWAEYVKANYEKTPPVSGGTGSKKKKQP